MHRKLFLNKNYLFFLLLAFFIIGGCGVNDPENTESSDPQNTAIVNISPENFFGDAMTIGDIIVNTELIPDGSLFSIEILENQSSVNGCILSSDFTVQDKVATATIISDYVLGPNGSIRVLINIQPINGAPFELFEDITVFGLSITAPTPDMGDSFVVEVDPMGDPPDPFPLFFNTTGLVGKVTEANITLSNPGIGSIDDATPALNLDGSFIITYSPDNTPGVQIITASAAIVTDPAFLALCPTLSAGAIITATVIIEQVTAEEEMGP